MVPPIGDRTRKLARGAIANLGRTATTLIVGFLVPPMLIRWVPAKEYSAYVVCFRVAMMLTVLDLGMQLTLTRRFA